MISNVQTGPGLYPLWVVHFCSRAVQSECKTDHLSLSCADFKNTLNFTSTHPCKPAWCDASSGKNILLSLQELNYDYFLFRYTPTGHVWYSISYILAHNFEFWTFNKVHCDIPSTLIPHIRHYKYFSLFWIDIFSFQTCWWSLNF